jgi:hypothetical protein
VDEVAEEEKEKIEDILKIKDSWDIIELFSPYSTKRLEIDFKRQ